MARTVAFDQGEGAVNLVFNTALTEAVNLGHTVSLSANNTVAAMSDGDRVLGKIIAFSPDEDECTVKCGGVLTDVPYASGTLPAVGDPIQASGANEVDIAVSGSIAARGTVLALDTSAETLTVLF